MKAQRGKVHFDPAQHFTWSDVLQEVENTQSRYQGNGDKGVLRSMREKLRSFQENTERVEGWLKLLPTESWQGSLVCGGIKLILTVSPAVRCCQRRLPLTGPEGRAANGQDAARHL